MNISRLTALVVKIQHSVFEDRRLRALARKRAEDKLDHMNAEYGLLLDDLKSIGVDVRTPDGKRVLARLLRVAYIRKHLGRDGDEMPESEIGGDW